MVSQEFDSHECESRCWNVPYHSWYASSKQSLGPFNQPYSTKCIHPTIVPSIIIQHHLLCTTQNNISLSLKQRETVHKCKTPNQPKHLHSYILVTCILENTYINEDLSSQIGGLNNGPRKFVLKLANVSTVQAGWVGLGRTV